MDKILNEYRDIRKWLCKNHEFIDSDNCKNLEKQILKLSKKLKKNIFIQILIL